MKKRLQSSPDPVAYSSKELKDMCRKSGLPVSGRKSELCDRLKTLYISDTQESKEIEEAIRQVEVIRATIDDILNQLLQNPSDAMRKKLMDNWIFFTQQLFEITENPRVREGVALERRRMTLYSRTPSSSSVNINSPIHSFLVNPFSPSPSSSPRPSPKSIRPVQRLLSPSLMKSFTT